MVRVLHVLNRPPRQEFDIIFYKIKLLPSKRLFVSNITFGMVPLALGVSQIDPRQILLMPLSHSRLEPGSTALSISSPLSRLSHKNRPSGKDLQIILPDDLIKNLLELTFQEGLFIEESPFREGLFLCCSIKM